MKLYFSLTLLVLASLVLAACGGGKQSSATPTLPPVPSEYAGKTNPLGADAAAKGAELFSVNCASCHGEQGHGDGPAAASLDPKPRNLAEFQPQVGDDYLFWRISEGVTGTSMPAWKGVLTEEQIWQVIAFVRTLK